MNEQFANVEYKNHMAANGLKAYIARAKYLLELQPKRDLDII